ncbi:MAG: acyl-CoA dehydratase activase-related protein [Desulfovibrio sp.]|jgi:predicted CoA-substrate-specific enzyme activase|nr:acyl-CoA dehydratase activase-related protein [Desulfovibrio sp.]
METLDKTEMQGEDAFMGLDVGSTTVKAVALDLQDKILFSVYRRHLSEVRSTVSAVLREADAALAGRKRFLSLTGSGAISLSSDMEMPFVQEVVASGLSIRRHIPDADVAIELGGEDAKLTFFTGGPEQRMNETCAGGTGAFIDQMAAFLDTDAAGLDKLAHGYKTLYPIASRCGVFAKTDILPLLNEGCARADIAASIMQAMVNQTISGLARGRSIAGKVVFLGGPLAFLPSLRERFVQTLKLDRDMAVFPEFAEYFVAMGAALHARLKARPETMRLPPLSTPKRKKSGGRTAHPYGDFADPAADRIFYGKVVAYAELNPATPGKTALPSQIAPDPGEDPLLLMLRRLEDSHGPDGRQLLDPLFADAGELEEFRRRHSVESLARASLEDYSGDAWLGIDSGSTTIKGVLLDAENRLLYSFYGPNQGDPLSAAVAVLKDIYARRAPGMEIRACAVTGYGSGLLAAGIRADIDEVETVAHFTGARFFQPKVSYILDIGGQDIKCMRVRQGAIDRIQLNEACSAGCGSFIETFAKSLDMPLDQFVDEALSAGRPVDLGTRCTVFMNSKVKQAQKDGAEVGDIAAGLSYSVVRNACYKVMKITNIAELGEHVVAQGGAFANDALLRALELQLKRPVVRPDVAGLMGAFGAALIARERGAGKEGSSLLGPSEVASFSMKSRATRCRLCANHCLLTVSTFTDGRRFVSGNRCERGAGATPQNLPNVYAYKYKRLFGHYTPLPGEKARRGVIGIPRALNIFENYPLWFTLFTKLGFQVVLSSPSSKELFFKGYGTIPSQTVCYPAKLAHGHILDLIERKVDCIFFPCLPFEQKNFSTQAGNFNCPVVIGYPELLAKNIGALEEAKIPFIHHFLPLDRAVLAKRLRHIPLFADIPLFELEAAVLAGFREMQAYKEDIAQAGEKALMELHEGGRFGVVLAGHPYHTDPEVHHGIADLITSCGMGVLTEDSVAHLMPDPGPLRVVDQWTYHSRLYRAGAFAAGTDNLAVLQLVSFGCGLDAITSDQLEEIVTLRGKLYAQIKVDEGDNLGPARIRIRSLLAALRERRERRDYRAPSVSIFKGSPPYTEAMRETHTILIPQLSPVHFRFLEALLASEGYKVEQLPVVERAAIELGLRYVNNDACFPAIVVVGQLLHAVRSGKYDQGRIALMISQTGGGCRATNYIAFLRKALVDCGMDHIPVISFNMSGLETNPGFKLTGALLRKVIMAGFYGDALMRMLYRIRPYELAPGSTQKLVDYWTERGREVIARGNPLLFELTMFKMVRAFDRFPIRGGKRKPRVGLVGEILLKYHPDANNRAAEIVEQEGGEAVVPDLMDFVLYSFYDNVFNYRHLSGTWKAYAAGLVSIAFLEYCRMGMRMALGLSRRFHAPLRFSALRNKAKGLISLGHQTGEGWLLAAEMVELLESEVPNILCMQPFGCLPNHITGKGLLKELKHRFPNANIAAVDYDPGASESNQINRIKLMMSLAK